MSWYRSKRWCCWDEKKDVELRHERSEELSNSQVTQVSPTKWLFASANSDKVYTVELLIEDASLDEHFEDCIEYGCADDDSTHANEEFCSTCDMCCHVYACSCPDTHPICKHIHKVHDYRDKQIMDQRPYNLDKFLEEELKMLQMVSKSIKEVDAKASFCEETGEHSSIISFNCLDKIFLC